MNNIDDRPIKKLLKYFYLKGGMDFRKAVEEEQQDYFGELDIWEKTARQFNYTSWDDYTESQIYYNLNWVSYVENRLWITEDKKFTDKFIKDMETWDV